MLLLRDWHVFNLLVVHRHMYSDVAVVMDVMMAVLLLHGRDMIKVLLVYGHVCFDMMVIVDAWAMPRGFSLSRS